MPKLMPSFEMGSSSPQFSSLSGIGWPQNGLPVIQNPVKSGLPSAARGVGADMLIVPPDVRGACGVGCLSHWARTGCTAITAVATTANRKSRFEIWRMRLTTSGRVDQFVDPRRRDGRHARPLD